ncbi:hypothetical protein [Catenulispora pinisilvae]|uniref:hypothetical protein n=1 Tax=Catenulispora pinisilvae TaxID=2705253 RepID=UPI0018922E64|nr:hypothetical protein [Catenulispora pinisilvae]
MRRILANLALDHGRRRGGGTLPLLDHDLTAHDAYPDVDRQDTVIRALRQLPPRMRAGHAADLARLKTLGEPGILQFRPVLDHFDEVPPSRTCTVSTVRTGAMGASFVPQKPLAAGRPGSSSRQRTRRRPTWWPRSWPPKARPIWKARP